MIVLVTGATGFIGQRLSAALTCRGHRVVRVQRTSDGPNAVSADFMRDIAVEDWLPKLAGVDAVINCVGILRQTDHRTFERIHALGPQALFAASEKAGVCRVVQISALGAADGSGSYFASKRRADRFLAALPLEWTIVEPSLVFGAGGASTRLFATLASLPIIPLPGHGTQNVQPVHVDDLVEVLVGLLERRDFVRRRIAVVGPHPLTLRQLLEALRAGMGLGQAHFVRIPMAVMRAAARVGDRLSSALLDRETLQMLERGNTADPADTRRILEREPRDVDSFITRLDSQSMAREAQLAWLLPTLRYTLAIMWMWTGVVSLGLYPREESYRLLAEVGLTGTAAAIALYTAASLDIALGVASLLLSKYRWLWLLQLMTIVGYTALITIFLPEFWLHPYGPILKNLPLLAAIYLLYRTEGRPWNM